MSPRGSASSSSASQPPQSARASNTPYTRRAANQPKSSRQQFSACGACRMRRVRCDLKDLPIGFVGPPPACSNCRERGIKCVDEFADVKAVKLLRRGRRLQQVEAIYGKVADQDGSSTSSLPSKSTVTIPNLQPEFFNSPFWRWLSIQRPILDVHEFPARFANHCKGTSLLANEGGLIAMLLVAWAASFGLDERGLPEAENPSDAAHADQVEGATSLYYNHNSKYTPPGNRRRQWKSRCEEFVREVLELVDYYGVLRRPTLDGLRVLLLVLPLMEDSQDLERLAISDSALSQVQALCVMSSTNALSFEDAAIRARLFWYAYTQEGMTIGLRGGRFVLNGDDFDSFQRTLPPNAHFDIDRGGLSSPSPDPAPNMAPYHIPELGSFGGRDSSTHKTYMHLWHSSLAPLDLNKICRKIHNVLTGLKATRRAEDHGLIDAHGMREIWQDLDRAWQELENRKRAPMEPDNFLARLEFNQYISAWQIFIFECHNVIREALKHFITTPTAQAYAASPPRPSSHSSNSSPYLPPQHLHVNATRRCLTLLPLVIRILRVHMPREHVDVPGIFRWDTGMVRDGCFYAGYLAANMDGEYLDLPTDENNAEDAGAHLSVDEGVTICLTALATMRWGFSKTEEREDTIRMIWENRKLRRQGQAHHLPLYDADYHPSMPMADSQLPMSMASGQPHASLSVVNAENRPMLPPLNLFAAQRRVDSAPSTAASSEDRRWPEYTPPPTATSIATSTGTGLSGLSRRGSPVFANAPSFKQAGDDIFYHTVGDMDQFSYNVPQLSGPAVVREAPGMVGGVQSFGPRGSPMEPHTLATSAATNYMAAGTMFGPPSDIMTNADFHSCPQFGENCNGGYH
ncbi:hypothetical protein BDN70DRAFT_798935 [Pholiota conissans]|uniref:Zn(2)-C6 fungal-type domain-containing protein n=1 Tax=Pholiota conissans TaxID=109636 RepID=A0A9P5ZC83_9AGAR|nr:hypothetical protein BDN70DRAFT_798935 [Pholiota conissans]